MVLVVRDVCVKDLETAAMLLATGKTLEKMMSQKNGSFFKF